MSIGFRRKSVFLAFFLIVSLSLFSPPRLSAGLFGSKNNKKDSDRGQSRRNRKRRKAIQRESESPYKNWIKGPISYIVTPAERKAFLKLTTANEQQQFIEAFWARRNPNPGSPENGFKDEFYRRIAYANEHYSSGIPGWRTDRGRIYIMYGPPDEIESHPTGGTYTPDPGTVPFEGPDSSTMTTYPFEDWTYNYIPGIGENVVLEFVDPSGTGEYHLTMNPCEKDAMAETPGDTTGCQGGVSIGPVWNPNLIIQPQQGSMETMAPMSEQYNEFTRLDMYSKIFQPPQVDFNDLKTLVTSTISANTLPFQVKADFIRLTQDVILTPITVEVADRNLQFQNRSGIMHATLDIYGQVSTLSGRVAATFDDGVALDVPRHDFEAYVNHKSVYQKVLSLRPGLYKLSMVVKDKADNHLGTTELRLNVPNIPDTQLATSSLILADLIEQLPSTEVGSGPFVIGGDKVRPDVDGVYQRNQDLDIYMQVYNLGVNPKTHRPSADIQYQILRQGKAIFDHTESAASIPNASEQLTIAKKMPLGPLAPGKYQLQIKVTDNIKKASDTKTADFEIQ